MTPLFSIITVTFNAAKEVECTLRSVKSQTFTDFEYLVTDGASKDNTLEIVKSFDIPGTQIVSEADGGLYDAMNKSIRRAKGEYLIFLNAGDSFFDENTLKTIAETAKATDADIVYGQTELVNDKNEKIGMRHLTAPEKLTFKSFKKGMLVCHQAFVARRSIMGEYDLKYRFSADYEWCLRCLKKSKGNAYTGTTLIKFLAGGTTAKNHKKSLKERYRIMCDYYGSVSTFFHHLAFVPRFIVNKIKGVG